MNKRGLEFSRTSTRRWQGSAKIAIGVFCDFEQLATENLEIFLLQAVLFSTTPALAYRLRGPG